MCCRRSRARAMHTQQMSHVNGPLLQGTALGSLTAAINNLTLKPQSAQSPLSNQLPVYTRDNKQQYPNDAPPAYEKVSGQVAPEVVAREVTNSTYNSIRPQPNVSHGIELPPQLQSLSPHIATLVDGLTAALNAYHSGTGRGMGVRRAQRALRDELYEEEVARRQSTYGRLRCGERKQVWREVKAINLGR